MKKGTLILNANEQAGTVELRIYGYIVNWNDSASGESVAQAISRYQGKYKNLSLFINSDGGSVTEGIAIFNVLRRSNFNISIYVDGVAASMAAVLLQLPGAKRYMAKYTRLMMHKISGAVNGSAEDLRALADQIDSFEADFIDIVGKRCGLTADDTRAKYFNGKDNWLTPEQALEQKLIDGIVDGKIEKEPANLANVSSAIDFYEMQILNFLNKNKDTMDLTALINTLGMAAGATEEQILNQVKKVTGENASLKTEKQALENKVKTLEDAAKATEQEKVKNMIDDAVQAKKITEAQRPTYEALAASDFENTKKALDAIAPVRNLRDQTGEGADGPIPEDRKNWTFQDWQKKDGKGLQSLKESHKETFDALYKKTFGN